MNASVSILLVDDEPLLRRATALMLSNRGGSVVAASTPDEAVELAALRLYDVAIFDVSSGPSVSELLGRMRVAGLVPRRVIAVCDGASELQSEPEVIAVLRKPYAFDRLIAAVFGACDHDRARARSRSRSSSLPRAHRSARARITARSTSRAARALPDRG